MKIDRMLGIVTMLLQRGTVTAQELADHFEVSARTIYRDADAISLAGIPIYTSRGTGGGISMTEDYTIGALPMSESERESLMLALQTMNATRYPGSESVLAKLSALFKSGVTDWVHIDFAPWGSTRTESERFDTIRESIISRRLLSFYYLGASGKKTWRKVEPMRLSFVGYTWYLNAYCLEKEAMRMFKLTRMRDLEKGERFERRDFDALMKASEEREPNPGDHNPLVCLRLRFHPDVEYRVYDMFDERLITRLEDGHMDVTVWFPEDGWVYSTILSFGPHVEVIEPAHIREIIRDRLTRALGQYL